VRWNLKWYDLELKGNFISFVKVAANKENSTNNFQEYFSKQLLADWNASYTTLDPLHILPQGGNKLGGRPTGIPTSLSGWTSCKNKQMV